MLTRADRTISDGLDVLDDIRSLGLRHIGFKDVGIEPAALAALHRAIKELGATSYLEVVSTTPEACLQSARVARELGVDRLLGGTHVEEVLQILAGSSVAVPAVSRPAVRSSDEARRLAPRRRGRLPAVRGARRAGVDLLAYRATEADPLELVRAARRGDAGGTLLVAGGVGDARRRSARSPTAGADAFTVGSAVFDGSFAPHVGSLRSQLKAVLDACALIRSRCCSRARIPIPRPASCSRAESRARRDRGLARRARGRARRGARRRPPRRGRLRREHARGARRARRARARGAVRACSRSCSTRAARRRRDRRAAASPALAPGTDAIVAVGSGTLNDLSQDGRVRARLPAGRVRDRAVDERLHVAERVDHERRRQALVSHAHAARRVLRSRACSPRRRRG